MASCLERGANNLHMVQLMPLPPHRLLFPVKSGQFSRSSFMAHKALLMATSAFGLGTRCWISQRCYL